VTCAGLILGCEIPPLALTAKVQVQGLQILKERWRSAK